MNQLSDQEIEFITGCLKDGKPLPESYRYIIPFETKKEYELTYADKEREEDILADTFAVPLQPVKTFGSNGDGWTNKLIFGDNLQVLKTLSNEPDIKGQVKLIYIDPPFGTGDIYDARGSAPAYSAKLQGAKFIEFIRKRLVFLREILADDGSIYVRTDYHFGHYLKAIMDEVFEKNTFRNEIILNRRKKSAQETKRFNVATDSIFLYTKSENFMFNKGERKRICNFCGHEKEPEWHIMISSEIRRPPERVIFSKVLLPPRGHHWTYSQERINKLVEEKKLRINEKATYIDLNGNKIRGMPEYLQKEFVPLDSNWMDTYGYTSKWKYPTENPEEILEKVISTSSSPGDLVLDAFAGSGTTGAVAEKLGRKWIMIDCGKLAIYTMQKRMLNLRREIGNRGKLLKAKPFTISNAGLYDYRIIRELPWDEYRNFVLKLFQCRNEKHRIAGLGLDGYLGADDVLVFNYKKYQEVVMDRGFIDNIHSILGNRIGRRFFIIAPAASVTFLEDYIEKGETKYFVLRIPYSIIDELHRKGFTHIKQPVSEMDVNDTVDAVGFDFIQIPEVECEYYLDKPKGQVGLEHSGKDAVIEIKKFESNIITKKPQHFENLETLSMVMVDYDYDGRVFDFDEVFYAEDLKKQDSRVHFDSSKINKQMMIIYIDIFGNEKREVKKRRDFRNI